MMKQQFFFKMSCFLVTVFVVSSLFLRCSQEEEACIPVNEQETYTKADYELFLRTWVKGYMLAGGVYKNSFIGQNGFPVWEQLKWYETENNKILTVPLVSGSAGKKVLVGLVRKEGILPLVVEIDDVLTKSGQRNERIYDLNRTLLYDTERGGVLTRAIGGNIEQTVNNVFENNSSVCDIFEAVHGNIDYDGNMNFGTLKICVNMDHSTSFDTYSGHTFIELNYNGNRTTFSTFGTKGPDYRVNADLNYKVEAQMETPVNYDQLQKILDYNNGKGNTDWTVFNNCTDYSIEVWNMVAGETDKIDKDQFGTLVRPKELKEYLEEKQK